MFPLSLLLVHTLAVDIPFFHLHLPFLSYLHSTQCSYNTFFPSLIPFINFYLHIITSPPPLHSSFTLSFIISTYPFISLVSHSNSRIEEGKGAGKVAEEKKKTVGVFGCGAGEVSVLMYKFLSSPRPSTQFEGLRSNVSYDGRLVALVGPHHWPYTLLNFTVTSPTLHTGT